MNSTQRVNARLQGTLVDRPPNFNIYMTFAAAYIGKPLVKYYLDHRVLVAANLAMVSDFQVDILQAISDPYREAADFGSEIEFPENDLPISRKPLLDNPEDLARLRTPDPGTGPRMHDRLEAVSLMRREAGDQIPVMGWVEGALAEAADLRGSSSLLLDLYDRPGWVVELLERCTEVAVHFACEQVKAGATIIGLGDAIASQISPAMYRQFALPFEKKIFASVKELGGMTRLHICGNTTRILPDMVASGAEIIDLDWMVDMASAFQRYGDTVSFCGNFDPVAVMLQSTPDQVYHATVESLRAGGRTGFNAAGCEIPAATPVANLKAQIRALEAWGQGRL